MKSSASLGCVGHVVRIRRKVEHMLGKVLDQIVHDVLVPDTAHDFPVCIHHGDVAETAHVHLKDDQLNRIVLVNGDRIRSHQFRYGPVQNFLIADDLVEYVPLGEDAAELALAAK